MRTEIENGWVNSVPYTLDNDHNAFGDYDRLESRQIRGEETQWFLTSSLSGREKKISPQDAEECRRSFFFQQAQAEK